ncbi:polycystin-1-like protein 2 [Anolis carolinensis]|uniref:polycystin-1-like protein 2 n=1 Tax=Anolis carolinensis TaxID=28377 RepID=UPI002F2B1BFC
MWLALLLGMLASSCGALDTPCLPTGGKTCHRLLWTPWPLPATWSWCWRRGGRILPLWGQQAEEAFGSQVAGGGRIRPQEQEQHPPAGASYSSSSSSIGCQAIIRFGDRLWGRRATCSQKRFFICQTGPPRIRREVSNPQRRRSSCLRLSCRLRPPWRRATPEPDILTVGPTSPPPGTQEGTTEGGSWPSASQAPDGTQALPSTRKELHTTRKEIPSQQPEADPHWPSGAPREAYINQTEPSTHPVIQVQTHQLETSSSAATGEPLPRGTSRSSLEETESPDPGPSTLSPQDPSPEEQAQALERELGQFSESVAEESSRGKAHQLKDLTSSPSLLSEAAQASASRALLSLSTQLLRKRKKPRKVGVSAASDRPVGNPWQDLFQTLGNLLQAMDNSDGGHKEGEVALEDTLASLPLIQSGLLIGCPGTQTTTVASPALSTTLSRATATSLPQSSFEVPEPRPVSVTFPSSPALETLMGPESYVQVRVSDPTMRRIRRLTMAQTMQGRCQGGGGRVAVPSAAAATSIHQQFVASFALNPFRQLNGKPIRSVASVALAAEENETAEEQALHVQGLTEEIEIVLGGEADGGEASAMSSSMAGLGAGLFSLEVNITSLEDALLVSVRPQVPLQITLHLLGPPGSKGNGSGSLLNTTFPEGQPEEETASVWVIPPESLRCGLGTYFISGEVTPVANASWNLSVGILSSGCYYWNSQDQAWKTDGCRVGPQSSLLRTQCLCNHLSFFGRFSLVLPHVIDLRRTGLLLSRVGQNPAGVALLSSLLLGYLVALIWARWRQRADARKVRVLALADNDPGAQFLYLVQVFTGYRFGAGTSAQAVLTLYGAEGRSRPHLLQCSEASRGLERGGMDAFLLATRRPLGNLHAARLWHNQTGSSPSWFVRHLVVRDLNVRRRWYFLCNCWLASDMDDGQVDKVFVAASQEELLSRRHLFWAGLVGKLTQEHLWLSVLTCSIWSPFTRVQRLSCCLALLLCSMLINIMFWKEAPRDDEPSSEAVVSCSRTRPLTPPPWSTEPFVVTWKELMVSAQVAVLMVPVNLMVVHVFKLVHSPLGPQHPPSTRPPCPPLPASPVDPLTHLQQELIETLGFLLKNILWQHREAGGFPGALQQVPELVASLCALVRSHLQALEDPGGLLQGNGAGCSPLQPSPERSRSLHSYICLVVKDLEAQLRNLDWCSLPKPYDYLHAADQLHKLWKNLEQHLPPFVVTATPSVGSSWRLFPWKAVVQLPSLIFSLLLLLLFGSPLGCCSCWPRSKKGSPTKGDAAQEVPLAPPPSLTFPDYSRWRLPSRWGFLCWGLVGTLSLASAFFTVLYSLQMSRERASRWALSVLLSVLQNVLLMQPLKVLVLTALFSLMRKKQLWEDEGQERRLHQALGALLAERQHYPPTFQHYTGPLPRPPALKSTARATDRTLREKKLYSWLWEIVGEECKGREGDIVAPGPQVKGDILLARAAVKMTPFLQGPFPSPSITGQLVFLAVLMTLSYIERSPEDFYLNAALQRRLTTGLAEVQTTTQFYFWASKTLVPAIYEDDESQGAGGDPATGLAADGNSLLVGSVRLRQIRAKKGNPNPWLPLSLRQEIKAPSARSWGPPGLKREGQGQEGGPWEFQSESTLREYPVWGRFALYPGSGYVAHLGTNASHAQRVLWYLMRQRWLDRETRAIFVELVVYNVNVNLFCSITLILENNGIGALQSKAELRLLRLLASGRTLLHLALARAAFLVLLVGQAFVQGRRMIRQKWGYFGNKRNLLDTSALLVGLVAFGLQFKRAFLAYQILTQYRQNRRRFISLYEMAEVDAAITYLIAFLLALATVKLWNLLRLNARMQIITQTLQAAWEDLLGFLLVLLVLLAGYSMACNLLFGWSILDYRTVLDSAVTIVGLLMGIFDYQEVVALDPVLGSLLVISSIFSMVFVTINLLVSVLLIVFGRKMKAAKASKEESMLQLIQLKISLLFGIKQQMLPSAPKETQD